MEKELEKLRNEERLEEWRLLDAKQQIVRLEREIQQGVHERELHQRHRNMAIKVRSALADVKVVVRLALATGSLQLA